MADWIDGCWTSPDGLRLHYRDYPAAESATVRPPILCISGLTRNARDWEGVADRLAGDWRIICVELRGRGESAYAKDPMTYATPVYLQDLRALLDDLKFDRFVLFGTSLGGLLSILLAASTAKQVAGILVNDVGPVLDDAGLTRIRAYVGRSPTWPTWVHAARDIAEVHRQSFPHWRLEDWLRFAKRLGKLNSSGRIVLDYDMRIADAFKLAAPVDGIDMWSAFDALKDVPLLVVRGETSDILSPATLERMRGAHPDLDAVIIPGVGHAPTLDEPEAQAGIDRLLAKVRERLQLA